MTSLCGTPVFATRARVTKVNSCGVAVSGTGNAAVTSGLVSTELQPQQEDGTEVVVLNGAGDLCVGTRSKPQLKWNDVTITLCNVDPELIALLTGQTLVLNDAVSPVAVGLQQRRSTYGVANFAWETWTSVKGIPCASVGGVATPYLGYSLLPWVVQGVMSNVKFENGAASAVINARTEDGTGWGVGPWNVVNLAVAGTPSPLLTALPTDTHHHFQWTTLAAPTAACGAIVVP